MSPEITHVADLSRLSLDARNNAGNVLSNIAKEHSDAFKIAHPDYKSYALDYRTSLSERVLESIVKQFAGKFPDQVKFFNIPTVKR